MNKITAEFVMEKLAYNGPRFVGYGTAPLQTIKTQYVTGKTLHGKGEMKDFAGENVGVRDGVMFALPSSPAPTPYMSYTEKHTLPSGRRLSTSHKITNQDQAFEIAERERKSTEQLDASRSAPKAAPSITDNPNYQMVSRWMNGRSAPSVNIPSSISSRFGGR
jgi:hypothetical protein